ncbi:MAG TPA: glycosyltransferase family 1 protein [Thermoanaerobaculia bacterium]|nr:glycosyltransferase family 1 protein [Thermoanaerobaculia bacterium]
MPQPSSPAVAPTVAVDLRALVPEATGIGVYTRSLLAALGGGRFRYLGMAHREPQGLGELDLPVETHPAPLGVLWQQLHLPRRLRAGDADLFWSPLNTLPLACPVPAVVTVHDLTAVLFPEAHTLKVRWSVLPFLARSLAAARRVVAVSRATADDLAFHFPECAGRVRVIHSGVDAAFHPADAATVARVREELGAPRGYVLSVGTLEPRKNLPALLSAWETLRADDEAFPPLVLVGGSGWGSKALRARIRRLEPYGVRLLGRVDDARLVELYQGARVFAYPSLYEGFGLPVLEAMACGVPVVTSDLSSLPEVAGRAALTVDPRDTAALARALARVVAEPGLAAELVGRGRERAAGFRWSDTAAGMEEVFAEALATGPAAARGTGGARAG